MDQEHNGEPCGANGTCYLDTCFEGGCADAADGTLCDDWCQWTYMNETAGRCQCIDYANGTSCVSDVYGTPNGACITGTCEQLSDWCVDPFEDCVPVPCMTALCVAVPGLYGHTCNYTAVVHCIGGQQVDCVTASEDCTHRPCYAAYCDEDHACAYTGNCADGHCFAIDDYEVCRPCLNATADCQAGPCDVVACNVDYECHSSFTCPEGHCVETQCRACVNATTDCDELAPCASPACNVDHVCYDSDPWPQDHCMNGTRVRCVNPADDCLALPCADAPTCVDGMCHYTGSCGSCAVDGDCETRPCEAVHCDTEVHRCTRTPLCPGYCDGQGHCTDCNQTSPCVPYTCRLAECNGFGHCEVAGNATAGAACTQPPLSGVCDGLGSCVQCLDDTRCHPIPSLCTASDHCSAQHACEYTYACPLRRCIDAECRVCVDPLLDCPAPTAECKVAACIEGFQCTIHDAVDGTFCSSGRCLSGVCSVCRNATTDCEPRDCRVARCDSELHACAWTLLGAGARCGEGGASYCNADGQCEECFTSLQCVRQGCTGTCTVDRTCEYQCGPGCVHAIGWWHKNAAAAFPPLAPVTIAGGAIVVSTVPVLDGYIRRAFGTNGLDLVAAADLLAKLNVAAGAAQSQIVANATALADHVLADCPPNDAFIWRDVLRGGMCDVLGLSDLQELITVLLAFSDGKMDVPLCTDIGGAKGRI